VSEEWDPIFNEENQTKLIEKIRTDADCKIYGVSKISQRTIKRLMGISLLLAAALILLAAIFYHPILTIVFLTTICIAIVIILGTLSYMNFAHNYYTTFVSSTGIAKKSVWDEGAIPWDKIEYIEVKDKGDGFDYILFRSGTLKLGYRNSHFAIRLSLDIISEYVGGIDTWYILDDFKELEERMVNDRVYMKPDIDRSEGQEKYEEMIMREWEGDQDYDAGQTQEQTSAKPDEELYELILTDPQCECVLDYGRFNRILGSFKIIGVMFFTAIGLIFLSMAGGSFSIFIAIIVIALFILMFYSMLKGYEQLIISPIGISRFLLGSPEAVEWQYVEFIDFHTEDDIIIPFEFFGNQRRIFCPEHIYKQLLTMDMIRKYIPNLDEWKKTKRTHWEEGVFRLVRPDE